MRKIIILYSLFILTLLSACTTAPLTKPASPNVKPISMNIESIVSQVNQYCDSGQISPKGTCNSLLVKLQGAIEARDQGQSDVACDKLNAFNNEMQAQSDKKIEPATAQTLTAMATGLCSPAPIVAPTAQ